MGTWGAGLFSDDLAVDVRDEYRGYLEKGLDGPAATERVIKAFGSSQEGDEAPTFWLALAATQWRYGRLQDDVKARALGFIEDGSDAARFSSDAKLLRERRRVLEKLKTQLTGPQKTASRVKAPAPIVCPWDAGDVIVYRSEAGLAAVFHVQGVIRDSDVQFPMVSVLKVAPEAITAMGESAPTRRLKRPLRYEDCFYLVLTNRDYKGGRFVKSGVSLLAKRAVTRSETMVAYVSGKAIDQFLSTGFE
jgi:hypothetical protein